jgi:acyl carrier protein
MEILTGCLEPSFLIPGTCIQRTCEQAVFLLWNPPTMTIAREDIQKEVNRIFVENFEIEPDELKEDSNLFDDLGLDSLDAIDMLLAMETFIGARLNDDDKERAKQIRTVLDVIDFVEGIASRGASA